MKGFLLTLSMVAICATTYSQSCPTVTSSYITHVSGVNYRLTLNYTGTGQKHFNVALFSGPATIGNFIDALCNPATGSGTTNIDFVSLGTSPQAVVVPASGMCGSMNLCMPFTVGYAAAGPLPILISSFNAKREGSTVKLNWKTQTEINAKEFIIEKSTAGGAYVPVKSVAASNKPMGETYLAEDVNASKANTLYRLKLMDIDGTYGYSETRMVKGSNTAMDFNIYPNPASSNSVITIPEITETSDVTIYDNAGRLVNKTMLVQGNSFRLNTLSPGMYMVKITGRTSGISVTKKLTIN